MNNINQLITQALREDIGDGDHTSLSTIPAHASGMMKLLVKEPGIIAGVSIAEQVFFIADPTISFKEIISDGSKVSRGDVVFTIKGNCQKMLMAERLMLNFMQRMSGIATQTRVYTEALRGTKAKLLDTRKTTPNMRVFEKMAVSIGGGYNHRMGLYDMIMIKDNHVDFAGGIGNAINAVNKYLETNNKNLKIEIEVRNFDELEQVLKTGNVDRIMLDNFSPVELKQAIEIIDGKYETEASGGINLENIRSYALTGVDFISVGAITHQIKSLDLSLKAME